MKLYALTCVLGLVQGQLVSLFDFEHAAVKQDPLKGIVDTLLQDTAFYTDNGDNYVINFEPYFSLTTNHTSEFLVYGINYSDGSDTEKINLLEFSVGDTKLTRVHKGWSTNLVSNLWGSHGYDGPYYNHVCERLTLAQRLLPEFYVTESFEYSPFPNLGLSYIASARVFNNATLVSEVNTSWEVYTETEASRSVNGTRTTVDITVLGKANITKNDDYEAWKTDVWFDTYVEDLALNTPMISTPFLFFLINRPHKVVVTVEFDTTDGMDVIAVMKEYEISRPNITEGQERMSHTYNYDATIYFYPKTFTGYSAVSGLRLPMGIYYSQNVQNTEYFYGAFVDLGTHVDLFAIHHNVGATFDTFMKTAPMSRSNDPLLYAHARSDWHQDIVRLDSMAELKNRIKSGLNAHRDWDYLFSVSTQPISNIITALKDYILKSGILQYIKHATFASQDPLKSITHAILWADKAIENIPDDAFDCTDLVLATGIDTGRKFGKIMIRKFSLWCGERHVDPYSYQQSYYTLWYCKDGDFVSVREEFIEACRGFRPLTESVKNDVKLAVANIRELVNSMLSPASHGQWQTWHNKIDYDYIGFLF